MCSVHLTPTAQHVMCHLNGEAYTLLSCVKREGWLTCLLHALNEALSPEFNALCKKALMYLACDTPHLLFPPFSHSFHFI